ncbi:PREDICTED: RNA-binding protein MEX3B-like [Charadrius vociferus]|uniref:RNA-binding protein MEX3B-like n=1 Tax=Charadrius vociferus TaxID=50402 RepID=UPI0005215718|nr:PREDICTED: RNA-binding protein MEX3B-like [Charadrius vociferus]
MEVRCVLLHIRLRSWHVLCHLPVAKGTGSAITPGLRPGDAVDPRKRKGNVLLQQPLGSFPGSWERGSSVPCPTWPVAEGLNLGSFRCPEPGVNPWGNARWEECFFDCNRRCGALPFLGEKEEEECPEEAAGRLRQCLRGFELSPPGCKIKALRAKTNTYIKTPVRGEEPVFIVTGRKEDVEMAKREILSAAEHFSMIRATRNKANGLTGAMQGPPNLPGIQVRVPYRVVGLVVGPKGATIKRIQQQTHTYIVTPSRDKEPVFEVTGMPENVDRAREEIEAHITMRTGSFIDVNADNDFHSNGTDVCLDLQGSTANLWAKAPHPARRPSAALRNDSLSSLGSASTESYYSGRVEDATAPTSSHLRMVASQSPGLCHGYAGLAGPPWVCGDSRDSQAAAPTGSGDPWAVESHGQQGSTERGTHREWPDSVPMGKWHPQRVAPMGTHGQQPPSRPVNTPSVLWPQVFIITGVSL